MGEEIGLPYALYTLYALSALYAHVLYTLYAYALYTLYAHALY
jgi:hypothetical protein